MRYKHMFTGRIEFSLEVPASHSSDMTVHQIARDDSVEQKNVHGPVAGLVREVHFSDESEGTAILSSS